MSKNHLIAGLAYIQRLNWPVFPCHSVRENGVCTCGDLECGNPGKHPRTDHGFKEATLDEGKIQEWWNRWPDANIGIPTGGASGFDVLDVDVATGGEESMDEIEAEHGKLPDSVEQLTGGGGRHILFRHKEGVRNRTGLWPGVDVRGEGGYIIVPPSLHESGKKYEWEMSSRPEEVPLVHWPDCLLEFIRSTNGQVKEDVQPIEGEIPEGQRNDTLTSFAGTMRRRGMGKTAIVQALLEENKARCEPILPEAEVRAIAASVGRYPPEPPTDDCEQEAVRIQWVDPQPLPAILPSVEPFNPAFLPEAFRPWVEDVAERMQCPIDFPAVAGMVALAAVVGRQVGIRPRQQDDWIVVPNLWGVVIGRPGVLKTPAIQEPLKALNRLEARAREQHESELKMHEAEQMVAEERKKVSREEIRKALKSSQDPHELAMEAVSEEVEPVRQRYIVNDTTVEKLGELLKQNPRGVLLFRDEMTGFLKSLDREGREGDRSFYLEAWNGIGRFTYDRIGRGTVDIEAACVSILGGIQPGPLTQYLRRIVRGGADDDGLLQRFQLLVWPDLSGTWANHDRPPDLQARQTACAVFDRLDGIDPVSLGAQHEEDSIPFLRFTPEAQEEFNEWHAELESRIRSGEESELLEAHLAKYRSLVPSLALLIHLADAGQGLVEKLAVVSACAWAEYLECHARRIYAPALSPATGSAHALAHRLQKGGLHSGFTLRELYRKHWAALDTREEAQKAVDILVELDWLSEIRKHTDGRWTNRYEINPKLEAPCGKVA